MLPRTQASEEVRGGARTVVHWQIGIVAAILLASPVFSQGLVTWVADRVGAGDVGRALDKAHDAVKQTIPGYGQAETTISSAVHHVTVEATVETTAPILKNLILASRDDALAAGAESLPDEIRWEFQGFYSPEVLDSKYRIGQGNDLSLQANAFKYGDRSGMALDTVVVFKNDSVIDNLWLWAHELAHIEQYRKWGVDDFAKSYIRDSDGVEASANHRANEFLAWRQRRLLPSVMLANQAAVAPSHHPSGTSTLCRFDTGTRVGEVQDFAPMVGIPVGSSCQDGMGSAGVVVAFADALSNSLDEPPRPVSTICDFRAGPRSGQSQDYAPMQPLPLGTPCQDGMGSTGVVVASAGQPAYSGTVAGGTGAAGMSTICRFTAGPRAGETQDYAPRPAVPVGTPCNDGVESTGVVVATGEEPETSATEPGTSTSAGMSTICHFSTGPRAGQTQDYAPMPAIPVGSPCNDGVSSTGVVIAQ